MSAKTDTTAKELDQQTARFIATLACNLPPLLGSEMQKWIDNPKDLKKFLDGLKPEIKVPVKAELLAVWKTLKLGTGLKTADDFRSAIKAIGHNIGNWGNDILGKPAFTASAEESEVDLVIRSVAELGFENGATRKQIYDRALELGLQLCPSEVGPQLRLQYLDQPKGEWLLIAMEPIADSDGDLSVFRVGHDVGAQWLCASYGRPGIRWGADSRWVFVQPRKVTES